MANQPPKPPDLKADEQDGGLLFHLRNEIKLLVKWHSPTKLECQMWRKDDWGTEDTGNIATSTFREKLTRVAIDTFGKDEAKHIAEDLTRVAIALSQPIGGGKNLRDTLEEKAGPSVTERLVLYARKRASFFHTADKEAWASVKVGRHTENHPVRSRQFRIWLRQVFWEEEKRKMEDAAASASGALFEGLEREMLPEVVRDQALADAISQLEAMARYEGRREDVYLRVAEHEGRIFIDLANDDWEVVEVSAEGWQVVSEPPVRFMRIKGMESLPYPSESGSLEPLKKLLNLQGKEGEHGFRLILAWLVQALRGRGPYPILVLTGERGSAKSTTSSVLRSLVDPSTVPRRSLPRNEHELWIEATSAWVLSIDNISTLPVWLSDALSKVATGAGFTTRTLYENREQELFEACRPIILNGITEVVTKDDIVQRALMVRLPPIPKGSYRPEREVYAELEEARPEIFGALLDAMAKGLGSLPFTEANWLPRMADFARWAVATEEALGGKPGAFMEAYGQSDREGTYQALESSVLSTPLWKLAEEYKDTEAGGWVGTATRLLEKLSEKAGDDIPRSREWPKAPNVLTRQLHRLAPLFREAGQLRIEELSEREQGSNAKQWFIALPGDWVEV